MRDPKQGTQDPASGKRTGTVTVYGLGIPQDDYCRETNKKNRETLDSQRIDSWLLVQTERMRRADGATVFLLPDKQNSRIPTALCGQLYIWFPVLDIVITRYIFVELVSDYGE